jgi:hypothetical protein
MIVIGFCGKAYASAVQSGILLVCCLLKQVDRLALTNSRVESFTILLVRAIFSYSNLGKCRYA